MANNQPCLCNRHDCLSCHFNNLLNNPVQNREILMNSGFDILNLDDEYVQNRYDAFLLEYQPVPEPEPEPVYISLQRLTNEVPDLLRYHKQTCLCDPCIQRKLISAIGKSDINLVQQIISNQSGNINIQNILNECYIFIGRNKFSDIFDFDSRVAISELMLSHQCDINHVGISLEENKSYTSTALILAIRNCKNDTRFIRYLLARGSNPNVCASEYNNKYSVLFDICKIGLQTTDIKNEIIQLLLEHGLNISESGINIDDAIKSGNEHLVQFFLNNFDQMILNHPSFNYVFPIHLAINHPSQASNLILNDQRFVVFYNKQDHAGYTPLHFCVIKNNLDFASFLIDHGCDMNIRNFRGDTPYELAFRQNGHNEMKVLFLSNGVNFFNYRHLYACPNIVSNFSGIQLLYCAKKSGSNIDIESAELLLELINADNQEQARIEGARNGPVLNANGVYMLGGRPFLQG